MKEKNYVHWILQAIAEERAPRAGVDLWPRIEARLISRSEASAQRHSSSMLQGKLPWRKAVLYGVILVMCLASMAMALIPTVRAQVIEWINGQTAAFSFVTPHSRVTVEFISNGPWGFVPLNPTYLPRGEWVSVPDAYKDESTGIETLKLTINKENQFIILTERKMMSGETLPNGKGVSVKNQPAVLATQLSGEIEAGIPLDKNGGVLPEPNGQIRLNPIQYKDGVRLTWQIGEIRLEILSNLPQKQVLKIAASLQPVETGPAEIITVEP